MDRRTQIIGNGRFKIVDLGRDTKPKKDRYWLMKYNPAPKKDKLSYSSVGYFPSSKKAHQYVIAMCLKEADHDA